MKQKNICDLVFENFLKTGEIGYYILYNKLKEEKHEPRNNNKSNCDKERSL